MENSVLAAVTALCMVAAIIRVFHETRQAFFFADDFYDDVIVHELGLTISLLKFQWLGEFVPLYGVAHWLYFHAFGLNFTPYRVLLAVLQCAIILMAAIYGHRRRITPLILIPALVLITCSPVYSTVYQWYSAATQIMAGGVASLAAVYLMATPAKLPVRRNALASCLYLAGMLLFPKGLFIAAILAAERLYVAVSAQSLPFATAVRRAALEMAPVVVLGTIYAAVVYFGAYRSGAPVPNAAMVLKYIAAGWSQGFLPNVFGLNPISPASIFAANLVLAALVAATIVRNRATSILWLGGLVYFLVTMAVIAVNRAGPFGIESAATPRYYTDVMSYFTAILLSASAAPSRQAPKPVSRPALAITLVLTCLAGVHLLQAAARVQIPWSNPAQVAAFIAKTRSELVRVGRTARIADGVPPVFIMAPWAAAEDRYSNFLRVFPHHGPVVPPEDAEYRFNDRGELVAVERHLP